MGRQSFTKAWVLRGLLNLLTFVSPFLLLLLAPRVGASSTQPCVELLVPSQTAVYDFQASLKSRVLDVDQLSFHISQQTVVNGRRGFHIHLRYGSRWAGNIMLLYWANERRFEIHSRIEDEFQGKGLGLMMYALAAKIARVKYQATLTSSQDPSYEAQNLWKAIVKRGWAEVWPKEPETRSWISFWGSPKNQNRFRFHDRVAEQQFGDLYDFFIARSDRTLPEPQDLR